MQQNVLNSVIISLDPDNIWGKPNCFRYWTKFFCCFVSYGFSVQPIFCLQNNTNVPDDQLTSAAATAESLQPRGFTLSTTQVDYL